MRATVRQVVVRVPRGAPLDGLPALLRAFSRYGADAFVVVTDAAPRPIELPKPARIVWRADGTLAELRPGLDERFLYTEAVTPFGWNLGALLAAAAAAAEPLVSEWACGGIRVVRRDGLDGGVRVLPVPAVPARQDRALLLDRDGVLNVDHGYVGSLDRFEWTEGALAAIRLATDLGWHVFVVTNQSGVARGLYDEAAVVSLLDWMADAARAAGGTIDDWRYCPFHPEAKVEAYRRAHPWRKPEPGMLLDLLRAWGLRAEAAVMVGDQDTDLQAAAAAGVAGYRFPGGNLPAFLRPILDPPR